MGKSAEILTSLFRTSSAGRIVTIRITDRLAQVLLSGDSAHNDASPDSGRAHGKPETTLLPI
jgi:hypothetical protein